MKKLTRKLPVLFMALGGLGAPSAHALSLIEAYRLAADSDATFLAARASTEMTRELVPQAVGNFLPSVGFSLSRFNANTESTVSTVLGPRTTNTDYLSKTETLALRQPLLRLDRVAQYYSATAQVDAAEATLSGERQSLALRVAEAYFNVLLAVENVDFVNSMKDAYAGQLARAERAYETGAGTRTDIDEAKARVDIVLAREIDAANQISQTERALSTLTQRKVVASSLDKLVTERLPLQADALGKSADWIERAEANSPQLQAAIKSAEAARYEVYRARAAHFPTVDLVATIGRSQSDTVTSIGQTYDTRQIGLQVNIPLYSGGQNSSSDRQAQANYDKYQQQAEAVRRSLLMNVGKELDTLTQGVAKIRAAEQAYYSATRARASTEKGVLAGTRNNVDVLNAQQQELSARVDAMRSRYDFIASWLRLNSFAGGLSDEQVEVSSRWMEGGRASN